jgi:two-component system nitrogen regulation response regulator GlnG/two-component system response regulator HydG
VAVDDRTLTEETGSAAVSEPRDVVALILAWCAEESERAGQLFLLPPSGERVFGRGPAAPTDRAPRALLAREIAGEMGRPEPLACRKVSREQLVVRAVGPDQVAVENVGRCALMHNGREVARAVVSPGDTLQIGRQLLFVCATRRFPPEPIPGGYEDHRGEQVDRDGIVGESRAAWEIRRFISFVAPREGHVLVSGESGTGKELVARAVHNRSPRAHRPLVARNAATLPDTLVDAELFGNARNYPNPGMADRPGLVGSADGSTLFLDELAELSDAAQAHLLRVLDGGEYQRLGESTVRRSNFRLVAATNRVDRLKHDLLARFRFVGALPALNDRREDIPILVRHIVQGYARRDPELLRARGDRVLGGRSPIDVAVLDRLVRHHYSTHVRELESLLLGELGGPSVGARAPEPRAGDRRGGPGDRDGPAGGAPRAAPATLTRETLEKALAQNDGSLERTWRSLGLSSRHALYRLLSKHGVNRGGSSPDS